MTFLTPFPATLLSTRQKNGSLHYFGTTDMNGILEVPDDDRFIDYLKAKFSPVEDTTTSTLETIGKDIKSNTTPITGDKGDMPNVSNGKASNSAGTKPKRTRSAGSNPHSNSKNSGGRGSKGVKRR